MRPLEVSVVALLILGCGLQAPLDRMSVCELIDHSTGLSGRTVKVRGFLDGSSFHGFNLYERSDPELIYDPCPGWPRRVFTCPAAIALESNAGNTSSTDWTRIEAVYAKMRDRHSKKIYAPIEVEVVGKVRRKWPILLWRTRAGGYRGNGFGDKSDFGVLLEVQSIRELSNSGRIPSNRGSL